MSSTNPSEIPEQLDQNQALKLLVQGIELAQQRGAFKLEDSEILARAKRVFVVEDKETTKTTETTAEAEPTSVQE